MFAVQKLQELGRKARVSLFLCFIDLQKAYDSVDRTLLWQMLARFGRPPQMIEVIRQFHDGMRACVRGDDDRCSEWFEVAQGPRQGCVPSPLLFNVFFAGILRVALKRFSKDAGILVDLIHRREQPSKVSSCPYRSHSLRGEPLSVAPESHHKCVKTRKRGQRLERSLKEPLT